MQKLSTKEAFWLGGLGLISMAILGCNSSGLANYKNKAHEQSTPANKRLFTPLTALASDSPDDNPHSLLLASNLIEQKQGQQALTQLAGLEDKHPLLAPYILLKQGKAYQLEQKTQEAEASWQKLIVKYPDSAATAEALYRLGKSNPTYWQQAIALFPAHPRTHQIARQLLQKNPNQPRLMVLLAKYTPDDSGVDQIRERLVKEYAQQLTPSDWQAIADGYWLKWDYGKAGRAYAQAPRTPRNLYRAARGHDLGNSKITAQQFYRQLIAQYPDAAETGLGLRRLAAIVERKAALTYLDRAIAKFPPEAPAALLTKAKLLDSLNSPKSAQQARQAVLTTYKHSEVAAEYRWQQASKQAQTGNLATAWKWAQPIVTNNPDSPLAPKAAFWIGKWAAKLGRQQDAHTAYKSVLSNFPRSYYAWRAAVALGWNVGDFTTVRHLLPQVNKTKVRSTPPAGSPVFQELYQLGLETEAWGQFQTEISHKETLTVAEEYTKGLMQLYQGKHLRGINQIWYLKDRKEPQEQQQWQALRQTPEYWQSLFPFPFEDSILKWSKHRQLNPLLVTALIRQESRFEPEIKSWAGATGLMQVMPATGQAAAKKIGLTNYSLTNPENNINIGTYYLDFTHQEYQNNSMLAVASYNAGPNAVKIWVSRYGLQDADEFVEKIPYKETKGYVESVFENYWNYMLIYNPEISQLFEQIS